MRSIMIATTANIRKPREIAGKRSCRTTGSDTRTLERDPAAIEMFPDETGIADLRNTLDIGIFSRSSGGSPGKNTRGSFVALTAKESVRAENPCNIVMMVFLTLHVQLHSCTKCESCAATSDPLCVSDVCQTSSADTGGAQNHRMILSKCKEGCLRLCSCPLAFLFDARKRLPLRLT